jgi:hypothetical protein
MVNVISFSLWGDKPIYTIGALRNADLAKQFYPDFQCWFYIHIDTVPQHIIDELQSKDNVSIIFKTGDLLKIKPMMWRFEAIDHPDVKIMMSRDTDTRFLLREKLAVDEWLKSDKICHIMRDHPWHNYEIQGGMFGLKKNSSINMTDLSNTFDQVGDKMYDQDFLKDIIYPLVKNNSLIHASFNKYEDTCIPFPIEYDNEYHFVGEYVYEDETRILLHSGVVKQTYLAI